MVQSQVIKYFKNLLTRYRKPADTLPALLLRCTAAQRPGVSAQAVAANIIELCKAGGIPTEENADGSMNLVNFYTYAVSKSILDGIKQDGVVQVVIPRNTLLIQATGGNAGGPVTCIGTNMTDTIAKGILR